MLLSGKSRFGVATIALSFALVGCDGSQPEILSNEEVETVDVPVADTTTTVNINIGSPTLVIPDTFPVGDGDELTLVWSDEFNGTSLDPETWLFEEGDGSQYGIPGWGNNEQQYYLPDNARLENGLLIITAKREQVGQYDYTSARLSTSDRLAVQYGRIEARMKLPGGQGIWPAFWMLPQDDEAGSPPAQGVYGGFSASGEIDIMEAVNIGGLPGPGGLGGGNVVFGTIHFGGEFPANQFTTVEYTVPESLTDEFNTFAVEWDETEIRWYANDILYAVQNSWSSAAAPYPAPFDQPFEILLNLAVGGNFPGSPDGSTPLESQMEVDWVRVYSGEAPTTAAAEPTDVAPDPGEDAAGVSSLFSDNYTDITGIDFAFDAGQTTVFSPAQIQGNSVLKYANLDFQIIDLSGNPLDASDKGFLHVDVWTADSTELTLTVSSSDTTTVVSGKTGKSDGGQPLQGIAFIRNTAVANPIAVTPNSWVSVDIPVTAMGGINLADITQLRFDGNGTIFVDNLYFAGDAPTPATVSPAPEFTIYASDPSDMVDLQTTITAFGTTSQFNGEYAIDFDFRPAFEALSGSGYGLDNIVQLGFIGLEAGFATAYGSFQFKIKSSDLPGNAIEVKLEQGGTCGVIDLADTNYSTPLGNGWFDVVVPLSDCAGVETAVGVLFERVGPQTADGGSPFSFLATDIGFNSPSALPGTVPANIIFASSSAPNLTTTITAFGTTSQFDGNFTLDRDFSPAFEARSGSGYGLDNIVQLGFIGLPAGFASAYDAFIFKIKSSDLPGNAIEIKLEGGGSCGVIALDDTNFSTALGNGWFQVEVPISNCAGVNTATGILFERVGPQNADGGSPFSILLTDIGFEDAAVSVDPGLIPDDVIYATDPGEMVDLVTTITAFGTTSQFEGNFTSDPDFSPVFEARSGNGYGLDNIVQLGFIGLTAGFATGYDEFLFKIKSSDLPGNSIEVKLEGGGSCGVTDLADTGRSTPLGNGWFQVVVPVIACTGVDTAVGVLFERVGPQNADGGSPFTILVTDIGFNNAAAGGGSNLAVNGDFETGDFTGWSQAVGSGVQSISTDTPADGGTWSASLSANTNPGDGGTTEIKQANLGAGTLSVGDVVTVSFDVKGTFGTGGQLNVLSFTEFGGGGADLSDNRIISGGVDDWTTQTFDVTLSGTDASGGFSLALNPVCGAVAGCVSNVLIDNVSITVN
ncbi:MAG: family 16 glycosylhydrolase [Pseudomonadota bacterium]